VWWGIWRCEGVGRCVGKLEGGGIEKVRVLGGVCGSYLPVSGLCELGHECTDDALLQLHTVIPTTQHGTHSLHKTPPTPPSLHTSSNKAAKSPPNMSMSPPFSSPPAPPFLAVPDLHGVCKVLVAQACGDDVSVHRPCQPHPRLLHSLAKLQHTMPLPRTLTRAHHRRPQGSVRKHATPLQ
jgi:hypothetical protein